MYVLERSSNSLRNRLLNKAAGPLRVTGGSSKNTSRSVPLESSSQVEVSFSVIAGIGVQKRLEVAMSPLNGNPDSESFTIDRQYGRTKV